MRIGVDYYPEHWDKDMWTSDVRLMAETGVKIVRLAEFAWCRLEPADGVFDFVWLDEAIRLFADNGIEVIIGTPTNCPPRWLCEKHPEILPVGDNGRTNPIGIRGHRCYNSPALREYAGRIVAKLAEHYKDFPNVTAWQLDNELEANICFCDTCNKKHREWLKRKYGTLGALNKAYGNIVWSGEYQSWEQIDPPYGGYNTAWLNPSYMIDFERRATDDMLEFIRFQADIIRSYIPEAFITTNACFCNHTSDFTAMFSDLDMAAYDNYPTTSVSHDYPDDPECAVLSDQYMFGSDILAAPIIHRGETERTVYLPEGKWIRTLDKKVYEGGQKISAHAEIDEFIAFVRAGAEIIEVF